MLNSLKGSAPHHSDIGNADVDIFAEAAAYTPHGDDIYNGFDVAQAPEIAAAHVTGILSLMKGSYTEMDPESARFILRNSGSLCHNCAEVPVVNASAALKDTGLYAQMDRRAAGAFNRDDIDVASGNRSGISARRVNDNRVTAVLFYDAEGGCTATGNTGLFSFASLCYFGVALLRRRRHEV